MECYTCGRDFDILYSCPDCKAECGYCSDHRYSHEHVFPDPKPEPKETAQNLSGLSHGQSISNTSIWRQVEYSYTTGKEWIDLVVASLLITLVFIIIYIFAPDLTSISFPTVSDFRLMVVIGVTASLAFIGHEIAHKVVAQQFGHNSRFVLNVIYISFSLVLALAGWFSVIVGVTIIMNKGAMTKDEAGYISSSGSFTNFVLGSASLALILFLESSGLSPVIGGFSVISILAYFTRINGAIGAIYMLPFGHLDGVKIWAWNKSVFVFLAIGNLLLWFSV